VAANPSPERRLKIAFVDLVLEPDKPGTTGLSDIVWSMARELATLGDEVHVVGPYTVDPDPVPGVTVHRFAIPPMGFRNIGGRVLLVLRAWRQIRRIPQLDLIHAPEYLSTGIIAPFSRVPVTLTTPGNIYERIANGNPFDWTTTQCFKVLARSSARYCSLIQAISHDMAWWWQRTGASPTRIVVIPHGVRSDLFHRVEGSRAILGLDRQDSVLVYVGRLSPEKQVDRLLRALARLVATDVTTTLFVVGEGPQDQKLQSLADELGLSAHVVFRGAVPKEQLPLWYSAADAVVMPSASEPLGRVMLEAMACGAVFVAAKASGPRDHVRHGENGFLVDPGCVDDLADCLRSILIHPTRFREVGERAMIYAQQHFAWPLVMREFREAIVARLEAEAGDAVRVRSVQGSVPWRR
jgi:glycosyltransferase involved in cell wall biosynthesis